MDLERLAHDVTDRHARVQGGVRVLQHDLDIAALGAHGLGPRRAMSSPSNQISPEVGSLEFHHEARQGFAAPGLPHDAEGLAREHIEGDAVDGPDLPDLFS